MASTAGETKRPHLPRTCHQVSGSDGTLFKVPADSAARPYPKWRDGSVTGSCTWTTGIQPSHHDAAAEHHNASSLVRPINLTAI